MDLGEKIEHAVIRETKEETTLDVEDPQLIDVVDNVDLDKHGRVKYHFVIVDYAVLIKSGDVKAESDAEELRWVPFDEVEKLNLTSSFRLFFRCNRQKIEQLNAFP